MLSAYFDESESQNPRDTYVVAACVSTADRWARFALKWSERLAEYDLPYFHTTEWATRRRDTPYAELSVRKHRTLGRDLRQLIEGRGVAHCFIQVLPVQVYREKIVPQLHKDAGVYRDPYMFCLFSVLGQIEKAKGERFPDERVNSFFEERNKKDDRRLVEHYGRLRYEFFPGFGPAIVGRKAASELIPCQAADLVAYESMRAARKILGFAPRGKPRRAGLHALSDRGKLTGGSFVEPNKIEEFIEAVRAHDSRFLRRR